MNERIDIDEDFDDEEEGLFSDSMDRLAEAFDLVPLLTRQRRLMEAIVICEHLAEHCEHLSGKWKLLSAAAYLKDQYESPMGCEVYVPANKRDNNDTPEGCSFLL